MLTSKQQRFVAEYLKDHNATNAAIRCGYSPKTANQQGSRLLANANISAAVAEKAEKQLEKAEVTAQKVLDEIARLAFSDVRGLFDENGNLKPIHTLDDKQAAAIASLEVVKKNAQAGDGQTDIVHKVKVWDKTKSLEMLAKHFALLIERVDVSGSVQVIDRLHAARKRLASKS